MKLTGDFNGDSYLDFIMNNGTVKLGGLNDTFTDISTGKTFNTEAKVVHALLDEEGKSIMGMELFNTKEESSGLYLQEQCLC